MGILRRPSGGWGEFVLVVICAFGYFIIPSIYYAFHPAIFPGHTTASFWYLTVYEAASSVVVGSVLWSRGWTLRSLGLTFQWADIPVGIGLAAVVWLVYRGLFLLLSFAAPHLAASSMALHVVNSGITPVSALSVVLVNPLFEEVFVTGYIVAALKGGRHTGLAVNISVAVRLSYHLYQGIVGVLLVVPLGLIFATWFVHRRRLWPLVLAHGLFDAVGIWGFVQW